MLGRHSATIKDTPQVESDVVISLTCEKHMETSTPRRDGSLHTTRTHPAVRCPTQCVPCALI